MRDAAPAPPTCWRAFPWDPRAPQGAPFSARFVPPVQGSGRFDPGSPLVLYLAESPEHAAGEVIQAFRGRRIGPVHLRRAGHGLAVVPVRLPYGLPARLANLTDPAVLSGYGVRPDTLASRDAQRTQAVARRLHDAGLPGFRWWSSLSGDWHTVVLFLDRVPPNDLGYGAPEPLTLAHPAVRDAAAAIGVRLERVR